ncbi:MAG: D-alanyl-D-alanine carboxypeptidase family protein, partial [Oscillospiraceae bacterium]
MKNKDNEKNNDIVEETIKPNYLNVILFAVFVIMLMYGVIFLIYRNMKSENDEKTAEQAIVATQTEETTVTTTEPPLYNYDYLDVISPEQISAKSAVLYNTATNTILFEKASEDRCYPASTTKLMTSLTALKNVSPDTVYTVGSEIQLIGEDSSTAYLVEGSQLTLESLIYAMLLPSGNDAAYCVAVNTARIVSGNPDMTDEEAVSYFCGLMNDTAAELELEASHFANPDGWYKYNHYVTSADMLKIIVEIKKNYPQILSVAAVPEYSIKAEGNGVLYSWVNNNKMLDEESEFYFPYSTGLKTGFTDECGYCYVATAQKDGVELVALLFGSESLESRYRDARNLFN